VEKTDSLLIALARSGDREAFGELIARYQPMARRVARGRVGDEEIAQDLAQEAMLCAYLSLRHLREPARFQSWLHGIVLNLCRSYLREAKMEAVSPEALATTIGAHSLATFDPQMVAEERERRRILLDAVNALAPENRDAILLFYYEQRSLQEIADLLNVSVGAVKGRLHRGRKQLREQLAPVYPEMRQSDLIRERRRKMVHVNVAGVYKRQMADGLVHPFIVLLDEKGGRCWHLYIGQLEAWSIECALAKSVQERPMTHDFTASLLREAGAALMEARVEALKGETYYGVVKLRVGDALREVDARPSDAIALALRFEAPVFVSEEIAKIGAPVTEAQIQGLRAGDAEFLPAPTVSSVPLRPEAARGRKGGK